MRNYGDYDNYMHVTGYPLQHGDSPYFLWWKNLQCTVYQVGLVPRLCKYTFFFQSLMVKRSMWWALDKLNFNVDIFLFIRVEWETHILRRPSLTKVFLIRYLEMTSKNLELMLRFATYVDEILNVRMVNTYTLFQDKTDCGVSR